MIRSDVWAVMALVAQQTQRLRIGTGVAVPGLRLTAGGEWYRDDQSSHLVDVIGLGTGNTAIRMLGHPPAKVEFKEYIRVVGALRGKEVDFTLDGVTHPITFANTDFGHINLEDRIPIHVGGFGPRAQALVGGVGVGLITTLLRVGTILRSLANVRRGAERAGRSLGDSKFYALVNLLARTGKTLTERVIREIGSGIR